MDQSELPCVDIVAPVYNEVGVIGAFHRHLSAALADLPYRFSILYVNDGSTDATADELQSLADSDPCVQVVELSRNFGHQAALTAGLDYARGDYVITLDSDGQHPVEMIAQMLDLARQGYDLVLTQRIDADEPSSFKRQTSELFYRLINAVGNTRVLPGGADFRLMNRAAVDALRSLPEYHRFLRGMVSWIGFRSVVLPYQPAARLGGESKYSLRKMLRLGQDAIFSFSLVPLYAAISVGGLFLVLALAEMIYVLSFWITGRTEKLAPGWSSLMFVLLVVGGSLMIAVGLIGVYIGYIFQESKRRPVYLVRRTIPAENSPNSDRNQLHG